MGFLGSCPRRSHLSIANGDQIATRTKLDFVRELRGSLVFTRDITRLQARILIKRLFEVRPHFTLVLLLIQQITVPQLSMHGSTIA
jgi:hypothetical protein